MEYLVKVDKRGRLTVPSKAKRHLKIGSMVRVEEKEGRLEIIPITDPLARLKGSAKARVSAEELDELGERILTRETLK